MFYDVGGHPNFSILNEIHCQWALYIEKNLVLNSNSGVLERSLEPEHEACDFLPALWTSAGLV